MNLGEAAGCAVGLARSRDLRLDQIDGAAVKDVLAESLAAAARIAP
jgi:hypothetical protein